MPELLERLENGVSPQQEQLFTDNAGEIDEIAAQLTPDEQYQFYGELLETTQAAPADESDIDLGVDYATAQWQQQQQADPYQQLMGGKQQRPNVKDITLDALNPMNIASGIEEHRQAQLSDITNKPYVQGDYEGVLPGFNPRETVDMAGNYFEAPLGPAMVAFQGGPHLFKAGADYLVDGAKKYLEHGVDAVPKGAKLLKEHPMGKPLLKYMGKGEGNQARGYGMYFAENKGVAQGYQSQVKDMDYIDSANKRLSELSKEMDNYRAAEYGKFSDPKGYALHDEYERVMSEKLQHIADPGHLYTVDIPDEHVDDFLDWDAPLSEQPDAVKEVAAYYNLKTNPAGTKEIDGGGIYSYVTGAAAKPPFDNSKKFGRESGRDGSEWLKGRGIKGIKYFDGGSRKAGDGTRNLVVFDEDIIEVLERNGDKVGGAVDSRFPKGEPSTPKRLENHNEGLKRLRSSGEGEDFLSTKQGRRTFYNHPDAQEAAFELDILDEYGEGKIVGDMTDTEKQELLDYARENMGMVTGDKRGVLDIADALEQVAEVENVHIAGTGSVYIDVHISGTDYKIRVGDHEPNDSMVAFRGTPDVELYLTPDGTLTPESAKTLSILVSQ